MKSFRKELWFNTPTRISFVNITRQVEECLHDRGVKQGMALVIAMHISAAVLVNDNDDESGWHTAGGAKDCW